jgi:hypothetical protein
VFNTDALVRLEWAVTSYIGAFGADETTEELEAYEALAKQVSHRLWQAKRVHVRFTYEDTVKTGRIDGFNQLADDTEEMAVIWVYTERELYRVPASDLIGPVEEDTDTAAEGGS